ncbi:MAG: tyrosine-protein phosphatase [Myxococcota bacterium]
MGTPPGSSGSFAAAPLPALERVANFRELGGLATRDGRRVRRARVFRSGHWGRASAADVAALDALGVAVVVDFRSEKDVAHEGADRLPDGCAHLHLPTADPAAHLDTRDIILSGDAALVRAHFGDGRAERSMRASAEKLAVERTDVFGAFLAKLAEPGCPPALFHCSAGKDRAGWAASCLLLALGVGEDDVVEHYLVSNRTYDAAMQHGALPALPDEVLALVRPLLQVRAEYAHAAIGAARARFGTLDAYFREGLGLADEQREQLRANWLEPA